MWGSVFGYFDCYSTRKAWIWAFGLRFLIVRPGVYFITTTKITELRGCQQRQARTGLMWSLILISLTATAGSNRTEQDRWYWYRQQSRRMNTQVRYGSKTLTWICEEIKLFMSRKLIGPSLKMQLKPCIKCDPPLNYHWNKKLSP